MSSYSISADSIAAIALDNQASVGDVAQDFKSTISSGVNEGGIDTMEQTVAGGELASRTNEYMGAGTDFSSTGTDIDTAQAIHGTLGMITDKIA